MGVDGKIIPRIRLTSAKGLVEVEAELGNMKMTSNTKMPSNMKTTSI